MILLIKYDFVDSFFMASRGCDNFCAIYEIVTDHSVTQHRKVGVIAGNHIL